MSTFNLSFTAIAQRQQILPPPEEDRLPRGACTPCTEAVLRQFYQAVVEEGEPRLVPIDHSLLEYREEDQKPQELHIVTCTESVLRELGKDSSSREPSESGEEGYMTESNDPSSSESDSENLSGEGS